MRKSVLGTRRPVAGILRRIVGGAAAPYLVYLLAKDRFGAPDIAALSLVALCSAGTGLAEFAPTRRLNPISRIVVGGVLVSLGGVLLGDSAKLRLIRESFVTGAIGALCLVSLCFPRPLMCSFGRYFQAGDDPIRQAAYDARSRLPLVRRATRVITVWWGITYVGEFALRVVLVFTLSTAVVLLVAPIVLGGLTVAGIASTFAYVRLLQRRAAAGVAVALASPAT